MMQLAGKSALITGASRGLGRAIAEAYAREGCAVAVNYVDIPGEENVADAEAVVAVARAAGVDAVALEAGVTDPERVDAMVTAAIERFGKLDILVNNAGIIRDRTIKKMTKDDWDAVIDVNLTGAFNCIKAVIDHMRDRREGRIISISSVIGQSGNIGQANYAASKAGIIALTKSVALELARRKVTANAIAPGFMMAGMTATLDQGILDAVVEKVPMGELGTAEDIAAAAVFLASDSARYITGQVLAVNGGLYM